MKVKDVSTAMYRIPLIPPLSNSTHGIISDFELITTEISTDDGLTGVGYTYTVGKGGAGILALVENYFKKLLIGQDSRLIENLWQKMWWTLHYIGRGGAASMAIATVDIALWDLKGKRFNEPLWRLLGGHNPKIPIYAGAIDLELPLDKLVEQMKGFIARGLTAVKMKIGKKNLAEDVERVAEIRRVIGPDVDLMVDVNNGMSVEKAIRASKKLEKYNVYWLEEPTIPDDLAGHVKISSLGSLPVAVGESLRTIYDFKKYIDSGAASFLQPDVSNLGGITPWMKVAHIAEAHNLPVSTHGVHDIHVHTLGAIPNSSFLEEHAFGLEKYIKDPLKIVDGVAIAPNRPGHGVDLDWIKLEAHREM
jgi:L-alanine-DL-glutamate epimerase-like enolase superfamily enzyme